MKRALAWVLVFLLIMVGAVIGTLAYLTDRDAKTNVFTIGDINIELLEYERTDVENKNETATVKEFEDNKPLIPGVIQSDFDYTADGSAYVDWTAEGKADYQSPIWDPADINNELDKMVFIKNTGTNSAYVRTFLAFEAGAYTSFEQFSEKVHLNLNEKDWTWKWEPYIAKIGNEKYFIATATYKYVLEPGTLTEISLAQIALDPSATNLDVNAFGKTYNVPIIAQGIQTASFSDPVEALETGFGSDIPFEGITFDKGVTLKTALTYFEGNSAGTKITDKVTSVTFGTKSDYPEISGAYSGALTLNDPGAPTHTYYVPSKTTEGNYDLYVLADEGKVYAPESCKGMFADMTSLTAVDAAKLDVSKTTSMYSMFNGCVNLQTVNTDGWVVDNVGSMYATFCNCKKLQSIDVSTWNTGNVTNMYAMFYKCNNLSAVDVSNWDVSKVTNISCMFEGCTALTSLEVGAWQLDSVTNVGSIFQGCSGLTTLDVSGWSISGKVTSLTNMFNGCTSLSSPLDLSGWDVSNVTQMQRTFLSCSSLPAIDVSGWDVGKVTNFLGTFNGCSALTELAVGDWNVTAATNTGYMFAGCSGLKSLNLEKWDVSNVTLMELMFAHCSSLTSLNVSTWDVSEVTNMYRLFRGCSALTSLNISDWNVQKVTSMGELFCDCKGLTKIDLSGWNTVALTNTNYMFCSCDKLVTVFVGDGWDVSKVTSSAHMFDNCSKLVGGENTKFVSNITDKTYARIDGGTSAPGYFTYKEHTPATP